MKIQSLHIQNFTVFEDQKFDFCDGINVFIGANATGKTHALKAMYMGSYLIGGPQITATTTVGNRVLGGGTDGHIYELNFGGLLTGIFKPQDNDLLRLVREKKAGEKASIALTTDTSAAFSVEFPPDPSGTPNVMMIKESKHNSTFIPSREVLTMSEGFVASYEKRELPFDHTYYLACKALEANRFRVNQLGSVELPLLQHLEGILGGEVIRSGNRFSIRSRDGLETEAHLMAEGQRKIAALAFLIANGTITRDSILFWDEPEANLNPKLITEVAKAVRQLAAAGVQVFLATHDALLTGELSLVSEYEKGGPPMRFFAFHRENEREPVKIEVGDTIADLQHNPIVEEFAAHYHRERAAFYGKALAEGK